jgi:hypothetical protein
MELIDLKMLAAASLLGGTIQEKGIAHGGRVFEPTGKEIETAVRTTQKIWEEVLKQDRNST